MSQVVTRSERLRWLLFLVRCGCRCVSFLARPVPRCVFSPASALNAHVSHHVEAAKHAKRQRWMRAVSPETAAAVTAAVAANGSNAPLVRCPVEVPVGTVVIANPNGVSVDVSSSTPTRTPVAQPPAVPEEPSQSVAMMPLPSPGSSLVSPRQVGGRPLTALASNVRVVVVSSPN